MRERIRIFLRRHQLVNETGNVVVQCLGDNTAEYVPGTVDSTWVEVTDYTTGVEKLSLSWDNVNTNSSAETTETNQAGSNYDKGISASLVFNDKAWNFIDSWLCADPCGVLNSIDVLLTDELYQKRYRLFEIKADNLTEAPIDTPCEFEVKLREADPVWHCVHKTFIWDNWQNWFIDGSAKNHPCFLTAVESRPRLLASARMGLSIFGRTIPIISLIFNETDDAFRRIQNVDNFVDAPLVRDIITNACGKCDIVVDTMFHDPSSPYYNLCLFNPSSGAMHISDSSAVTSPGLSFHFENRWNITIAEFLDKLKPVFNAEWYVTPDNTLRFFPRLNTDVNDVIYDFTLPNAQPFEGLRYTFNGGKKPAYGKYSYNIDASDLASQESQPLYNDIVDYDGPANNLMLEGNTTKIVEFASTAAVRDGRAKQDYLRATVSDGETVAYALIIVLAVIIASLLAGVLSAGAAAALAAFLGVWALNVAGKANDLRTLFGSATYTGAVRLTSEQVASPRLIIWDGVSLNRAKMVSVAPGSIAANTYYNPTSQAYDVRNKFMYAPAAVFNYPMYYESYYTGNLFDRFHNSLDNPLKSLATNQTFELTTDLCLDMLNALGVWENDFAKIGYFIKIQLRTGYDINGRIEHFELNYDDEQISIKGRVYKIKT